MPPFELYHGASNEGQSALGFALSELQAVDVLQSNSVLIHLFTNDKFYTPAAGEKIKKNKTKQEHSMMAYSVIEMQLAGC